MKPYNLIFITLFLLSLGRLIAQDAAPKPVAPPTPDPKRFITKHECLCGGETLKYTATAAEMFLRNDKNEATAAIWSTTYTREGTATPADRPVMFVFNGGPGSASVWLHMGMFGPKIVQVPSDAETDDGASPYKLVDNPYCLLDLTDLVFIDPVGTGFSKVMGPGKVEDFWGLNEDATSIARFIRQWITEYKRWNAPKFIAGESFGTTRAAAVADVLSGGGQNMALNGLVLISQALDYTGSTPTHDNLIANVTYLPTMAATAWYHGKAGSGKTLVDFVQEARTFASDEYLPALFKGNLLTPEQQTQIADRLAYFLGLDRTYILRSDLRVLVYRFRKELLRDKGLTVGGLDGRYTQSEPDQAAESPTLGDAASNAISSAYTAALNAYIASNLQVTMDQPYLTSNSGLFGKWNWRTVPPDQGWEPAYVNTARQLSNALRVNKDLRVLVANGYYDLVTPFFDAEYTFARHGILPDRVDMKYYEAGHMMYVHRPDLERLATDVRLFLADRLKKNK